MCAEWPVPMCSQALRSLCDVCWRTVCDVLFDVGCGLQSRAMQVHANKCLLTMTSSTSSLRYSAPSTASAAPDLVTVITDSSQEFQQEPVQGVQPELAQQKPQEQNSEIIDVEDSPPPCRRRAAAAPSARPALAPPSRIEHFFKKSRA